MVTNNLALADYDLLRWIPLIPLLAAVFNLFWGRALGRKTAGALACAAVGASFVLAFYVFWQLPANGVFRDLVYTWIDSGSFKVNLSFQVDALSAVVFANRVIGLFVRRKLKVVINSIEIILNTRKQTIIAI